MHIQQRLDSIPKRAEITDNLESFVAPGEYEPVTFCVRPLKGLKGLEVKVSELVSQNGGRIAAPQVQIVRCVPRLLRGEEPLCDGGRAGVMNMPTYSEHPRLLDVARSAAATRKRMLESVSFTDNGLDTNRRGAQSRWDTLIASPGVDPVVKGANRLHNGWDFETYDRNRRDIAEAIIQLQKVLP